MELDPNAHTLALEVELPNPGGSWRPGMLARIELPRRTLPDAVLVPLSALVDFEREKVLYVVEDGRARRRVVELGPVIGEEVVINRGVGAGAVVIVDGQQQVLEGQPVVEARQGRSPCGSPTSPSPAEPRPFSSRLPWWSRAPAPTSLCRARQRPTSRFH